MFGWTAWLRLVTSAATLQHRFAGFQIPIAKLAPEEPVEGLGRFAELIFGQRFSQLANGSIQLEQNPFLITAEAARIDFALRARTKKVAWNTSSASCSWANTR